MNLMPSVRLHFLHHVFKLIRLDQTTGFFLILWPGLWSITLAATYMSFPWHEVSAFILGAFFFRSSGCILNDIIDRKIDLHAMRTQNRPIAAGHIPVWLALTLLVTFLTLALICILMFNGFATTLGLLALIPLVIYPFLKRYTHWPQLFFAFMVGWGAIVGWAAIDESLNSIPIILYVASICWVFSVETIYVHQDKIENAKLGIKSSALKLGFRTQNFLYLFYILTTVSLWVAGVLAGLNLFFHIFLLLGAFHLWWQAATVNLNKPADCMAKYQSNTYYGAIILIGIVLGSI